MNKPITNKKDKASRAAFARRPRCQAPSPSVRSVVSTTSRPTSPASPKPPPKPSCATTAPSPTAPRTSPFTTASQGKVTPRSPKISDFQAIDAHSCRACPRCVHRPKSPQTPQKPSFSPPILQKPAKIPQNSWISPPFPLQTAENPVFYEPSGMDDASLITGDGSSAPPLLLNALLNALFKTFCV